jgi:hypothetical protein
MSLWAQATDDALIAVMDANYHHSFWRPITAIVDTVHRHSYAPRSIRARTPSSPAPSALCYKRRSVPAPANLDDDH